MTIQEAIKSGKPFRRKVWDKHFPNEWYVKRKSDAGGMDWWVGEVMRGLTEKGAKSFIKDILATDWEIRK